MVQLIDNSTVLGNLFKHISQVDIRRYEEGLQRKSKHEFDLKTGFLFYDLFATIIACHPEVVTNVEEYPASVELAGTYTRGMMVVDRNNRSNMFGHNGKVWLPKSVNMDRIMSLRSLKFD